MPQETLVVGADEQVVAAWVDVEGGDPAGAGEEGPDLLLYGQVVDPDVPLRGDEEVGFVRVEVGGLDEALGFAEGGLRVVFAKLVDEDGFVGAYVQVSIKCIMWTELEAMGRTYHLEIQ